MKKNITTNSTNSKGVQTMKKTLLVLALAAVLVFSLTTVASAKYAGYLGTDAAGLNTAYVSWGGATDIAASLGTSQTTPHGGYTATSVKCVVCHSTHRAYSGVLGTPGTENTVAGLGADNSLLNGASGSCTQCHAAWGASPSAALIEVGQNTATTGPHIGGNYSCTTRACHGSVHGSGTPSKYAIAVKYNLTNGTGGALDTQMDAAIAAGNVNYGFTPGVSDNTISTTSLDQGMKAYATGYVCFPCHGNSSFSVAARGYANEITYQGVASARTGHPSTGSSSKKWIPTCEGCHDMIGSATGTTAFPHATRGIDVLEGRFDNYTQTPVTGAVIATDNTSATQYGLWMTSAEYHDNAGAKPIVDKQNGYSLQDGSCIKCHEPAGLK